MKKRIIPTLILCALCAACDAKSNASGNAASGATPAAKSAATSAPKVEMNYRADLVSLLAGSYSGDCSKPPALGPVVATVLVTADGALNTTGISGNLLGNDVWLNFSRQFNASAVQTFVFSATIDNTFGLILQRQLGDPTGDAQTYRGASAVVCRNSAETAKLATKSLFSPIEKYFTAPARDLNCLVNGSAQTVRYQVLNGAARLGDEIYSFATGLKSEGVLVDPAIGDLNYLVEMLDGRSINMTMDKFGVLDGVNFKSGTGAAYSCTPE